MLLFCLCPKALSASWQSTRGNPENTGVSDESVTLINPFITSFVPPNSSFCQAVGTPLVDLVGNWYISFEKVSFSTGTIQSYDRNFHLRWQCVLEGGSYIPTLDDARATIYVTSAWNNPPMTITAISTVDGTRTWNYTFPAENSVVTAPPFVHPQTGRITVILENYRAVTFDPLGGIVWNSTFSKQLGGLQGLQPALQDSTLLLASQTTLYGLDVNTGTVVFRTAGTPNAQRFSSGPVVDHRGVCYIPTSSYEDNFNQFHISLFAYQCVGGNDLGALKWTYTTPAPFPGSSQFFGTPALSPDGLSIYIGSTSLLSIGTVSGNLEWTFNYTEYRCKPSFSQSAPVVGSDGTIFVGDIDNTCTSYAFALRPAARGPPEVTWKLPIKYGLYTVTPASEQLVYFSLATTAVWIISEAHSNSSASPSAIPTLTPTTTNSPLLVPSASPTDKSPSVVPSAVPTPLKQPSTATTPTPSKPCECGYSYQGSASSQVCQQCIQAAPCCTYCPTEPGNLCQTTTSAQQCSNAITEYGDCLGGSGSEGSSSSSIPSWLKSPSSLPGWKTAVIVLSALGALGALVRCYRRRYLRRLEQAAPTQVLHETHADIIPAPHIIPTPMFGQVINPVLHGGPPAFGDEEGGRPSLTSNVRRLAPSAPQSPYEKY